MSYEAFSKLRDLTLALNYLEYQGERPRLDPEDQRIICVSGEVYYDPEADRWYMNTNDE